jgi:transcriptional regulator with XRE-family HTH domain
MNIDLRKLIKDSGMSISELAKKIGITQANMSNIVSEKTKPRPETIEKIAKALDISVSDFYITGNNETIIALASYKGKFFKATNYSEFLGLVEEIKEIRQFEFENAARRNKL